MGSYIGLLKMRPMPACGNTCKHRLLDMSRVDDASSTQNIQFGQESESAATEIKGCEGIHERLVSVIVTMQFWTIPTFT